MTSHWIKRKDGKEFPIRFTEGVMMSLAVEEGIHLNLLGKFASSFSEWPLGRVFRYYHLAFKSGGRVEGKPFDMTDDEFIEWLSEEPEVMDQVSRAFVASLPEVPEQKKTKAKR